MMINIAFKYTFFFIVSRMLSGESKVPRCLEPIHLILYRSEAGIRCRPDECGVRTHLRADGQKQIRTRGTHERRNLIQLTVQSLLQKIFFAYKTVMSHKDYFRESFIRRRKNNL